MEGLANLVTESLVRHGFQTTVDHRRLEWSLWFPCQDRLSLLLVPFKPGLFALAEEVAAFSGVSERRSSHPDQGEESPGSEKRMLALFHIAEADDLGMALGRLMLSGNPLRERLTSGRCFARYVVIEDAVQRHAALAALQRWMASPAETPAPLPATKPGFASGYGFSHTANAAPSRSTLAAAPAQSATVPDSSNEQAQIGPPAPIPSGF